MINGASPTNIAGFGARSGPMIDLVLFGRDPSMPMLVDEKGTWSVGEVRQAAASVAAGLLARGLRPGERVAVCAPQGFETAIVHLAVLWAGGVSVPLSVREAPAAREGKLQRAAAVALFHAPSVPETSFCDSITIGAGQDPRFSDLLDLEGVAPALVDGEDPAFLIFTSGTTGTPRGAILPHRILAARRAAFSLAQNGAPQPGDRFWTPVEWNWVGSLIDSLFTPWALGIPVVVNPQVNFDPERAAQLISSTGVRNAFMPPTALRIMQNHGVKLDAGLRALHSGGEALNEDVIAWAGECFGVRPNEIYGQTEASFLIGSGEGHAYRPGWIGRAYPPHRLELLGDGDEPVPAGEVGEICVPAGDPTLFLGYLGEDPLPSGGWWHTGDLAIRDEDGYIRFVSRKDDLILSSGYRVDPQQVEMALMVHPDVALAAVVGEPCATRGQVPVAFVTLHPGVVCSTALAQAIVDSLRDKVPGYARPTEVRFLAELPLTVTGKVARSRLRSASA